MQVYVGDLRARSVDFTATELVVTLADGRKIVMPLDWYPPDVFRPKRPNTFLHCVSDSQRARGPDEAKLLPVVPNGVALDAHDTRHARRRFALALARICPEKGFHIALDAAQRAGFPLLIAGETFRYAAHEAYFAQEIAPRLDRARRFVGAIGMARKRRLLSAARCLLIPSLAPDKPMPPPISKPWTAAMTGTSAACTARKLR